jgi:hypothetical protein
LNHFIGFILLYLRITDSINEIGSKQIHFIFKNLGGPFFFIKTPRSDPMKETLIGHDIHCPML